MGALASVHPKISRWCPPAGEGERGAGVPYRGGPGDWVGECVGTQFHWFALAPFLGERAAEGEWLKGHGS